MLPRGLALTHVVAAAVYATAAAPVLLSAQVRQTAQLTETVQPTPLAAPTPGADPVALAAPSAPRGHAVGFIAPPGAPWTCDTARLTNTALPTDTVRPAGTALPILGSRAGEERLAFLFLGGTIAAIPLDHALAEELQDPRPQAARALRTASRGVQWLADPGSVVLTAAAFGVGRLTGHPHLAALGLRSLEAVALSGVATGVIKGVVGRERPAASGLDSDELVPGRGFTSGQFASFPSGHATAAFAFATVSAEEMTTWWPHASKWLRPVLYTTAGLVGLARMYNNRHWASDVIGGAGIGTLSGLEVERWHHAHPHNRLDQWLLPSSLAPSAHGVMVAWTIGR